MLHSIPPSIYRTCTYAHKPLLVIRSERALNCVCFLSPAYYYFSSIYYRSNNQIKHGVSATAPEILWSSLVSHLMSSFLGTCVLLVFGKHKRNQRYKPARDIENGTTLWVPRGTGSFVRKPISIERTSVFLFHPWRIGERATLLVLIDRFI